MPSKPCQCMAGWKQIGCECGDTGVCAPILLKKHTLKDHEGIRWSPPKGYRILKSNFKDEFGKPVIMVAPDKATAMKPIRALSRAIEHTLHG